MNRDGTVKGYSKISDTQGGFNGTLDSGKFFENSVSSVADLDGDGISDLAVGVPEDTAGCIIMYIY